MGGQSSQNAQQQQQTSGATSQTSNYNPQAVPLISGILGGAQNLLGTQTPNAAQQAGIQGLLNQAYAGNPYAPAIGNYATNLLNGGNANAQAPLLQNSYNALQSQLSPYANGSQIGAANPYVQNLTNTLGTDITNQINSEFAAAGRDNSGLNQQALARGLSQGLAAPLLNQYNTDVQNQLSAANSLYGAGNTTAGNLTGLSQQGLANQGQGVDAATSALSAQAAPYNQLLNVGGLQTQIPQQALSFLAQLGVPIAGLSGTTTGTSQGNQTGNIQQTNQLSPVAEASGWANVFGKLFGS